MTTTATAIRNSIEARIAALTPAVHAGQPFRAHRHERPIREWAEQNPSACLRRFSVRWVGPIPPALVTNTDVEQVERAIEVVVAYPTDWRHGGKQLVDLDEVASDDARLIADCVGTNGAAAMALVTTSATVVTDTDGENLEPGPVVTFGVVRLRAYYYRSTP